MELVEWSALFGLEDSSQPVPAQEGIPNFYDFQA